jgi:hypothetical protein
MLSAGAPESVTDADVCRMTENGLLRPCAGRGRDTPDLGAGTRQGEISSYPVAPQQALDVARYVMDMTAQLEVMAVSARLDPLAYFLSMARAEADLYVRGNARAERSRVESAETGPETDDGSPPD